MTYHVKNYTSDELKINKEVLKEVIKLSNKAYLDPKNKAKDNYKISKNSSTLLHIIFKQNRFDDNIGILSLLYDEDNLIGFAGAYKHTNDILICLVRAFILKPYRAKGLFGKLILPQQIEYAKANNFKVAWLTFNEYNEFHYNNLYRSKHGDGVLLGSSASEIYKGLYFYTERKYIQNTWQKVVELPVN